MTLLVEKIEADASAVRLRIEAPRIAAVHARSQTDRSELPIPFRIVRDRWLELRFDDLSSLLPNTISRFDLRVLQKGASEGEVLRVPGFQGLPIWRRYFRSASVMEASAAPHLYINRKGFVSLLSRNALETDNTEKFFAYEHEIRELRLRPGRLTVDVGMNIAEPGAFSVVEFFLKLNSRDREVSIPASRFSTTRGSGMDTRGVFNFSSRAPLAPLRYTLYATLEERTSGERITLKLDHLSEPLYTRLHHGIVAPRADLGDGRALALSTNLHTTNASFLVRELSANDRRRTRQRIDAFLVKGLAYLQRKISPRAKPTMLIFEKHAATAQDNGYAFYRYLEEQGRGRLPFRFLFVIDSESPHRKWVPDSPRVVAKHSFTVWWLLAKRGTFTVSSDVRFHLAERYAQPDLLNKYLYMRRNYFLQHGVLGLKKVGLLSDSHAMLPDAVVASSEWERRLMVSAGYARDSIDVVGLARWDRLEAQTRDEPAGARPRRILFMPTWRTWLEGVTPEDLQGSDYFQNIAAFLQSPLLERILSEADAELHFVPHPLMYSVRDAFGDAVAGVTLADQSETEFSMLLSAADILITDYSSIIWDFVQMRKPTLLFQFDASRYSAETGMYSTPEFLEILNRFQIGKNGHEVLGMLEGLLKLPQAGLAAVGEELSREIFPFTGRDHSKRTLEAIIERLPSLTRTRQLPGYERADLAYTRRQRAIQRAQQVNPAGFAAPQPMEENRQPNLDEEPRTVESTTDLEVESTREAKQKNFAMLQSFLVERGIDHFVLADEKSREGTLCVETADWPRFLYELREFSASSTKLMVSLSDAKPAGGLRHRTIELDSTTSIADLMKRDSIGVLLPGMRTQGLLLGRSFACRIERWDRAENGTLVPRNRNLRVREIAADAQERGSRRVYGREVPTFEVLSRRTPFEIDEPFDLIYMWVDGNDSRWRQKRDRALEALTGEPPEDSVNPARFRDNGELKYSMRSVLANCSWVRNIMLVTDDQVPDWLDVTHPRIRVVDHRELFGDAGALPTFNSHAIAGRLHHISGLSDRYVILNDDVFFGHEVGPETFFLSNGMMKFFLSKSTLSSGNEDLPTHEVARHNSARILQRDFGFTPSRNFFHTPLAQSREVLFELEARYPEIFEATWSHQTRSSEDYEINAWLHNYYGYATRRALPGTIQYDYFALDDPNLLRRLERLLARRNVATFCINDSPEAQESHLFFLQDWFERYFPTPAPWEK